MRKLIAILFFIAISVSAQKSIHNYAYLVVPDQFSFQAELDQYQLNSLTRFLFEKNGMVVFKDSEKIPQKYRMLDCAGLKLKMNKKSSMFRIKVNFDLLDCNNEIVFSSEVGSSGQKQYDKGYAEAIRNAFASFSALNYTYEPIAEKVEVPLVKPASVPVNAPTKLVYENEAGLQILLKESNGNFMGKVIAETMEYSQGTLICKMFKSSLPNVFKAQWRDTNGNLVNTLAYFDDQNNLCVDFPVPSGITVLKFKRQ